MKWKYQLGCHTMTNEGITYTIEQGSTYFVSFRDRIGNILSCKTEFATLDAAKKRVLRLVEEYKEIQG